MYVPTTAPLPPNSQTPPSRASVEKYRRDMLSLALAVEKGKTAQNCAYATAVSTQPIPTQIPNLRAAPQVVRPDARPAETMADRIAAQQQRASLLQNTPNLTQEQRDAIADAPRVLNTPQPCPAVVEESVCPQNVSAPPWGNAAAAFPSSACVSPVQSVVESVKKNPLLWLGLVVVGGFALNSMTD